MQRRAARPFGKEGTTNARVKQAVMPSWVIALLIVSGLAGCSTVPRSFTPNSPSPQGTFHIALSMRWFETMSWMGWLITRLLRLTTGLKATSGN